MKYIVLLLIILALILWLSYRFRRQISIARQIWKLFAEANRNARQQAAGGQPPQQQVPAGKLVRCSKCGTWTPEDTALKFGGNNYFCSPTCMERSVVNN